MIIVDPKTNKNSNSWENFPGNSPILATSHLLLSDSLITVEYQGTKSPLQPANQKASIFFLEFKEEESK